MTKITNKMQIEEPTLDTVETPFFLIDGHLFTKIDRKWKGEDGVYIHTLLQIGDKLNGISTNRPGTLKVTPIENIEIILG